MFRVSQLLEKSKSYEFWRTFVVLDTQQEKSKKNKIHAKKEGMHRIRDIERDLILKKGDLPFKSLSLGTGLNPARGSSQGLPAEW